jgi:hypothetical protein
MRSIRSVSQYQSMFENLEPWQAAEWVLRDLFGYQLMGRNNHLPADRERLGNAFAAWVLVMTKRPEDASWL